METHRSDAGEEVGREEIYTLIFDLSKRIDALNARIDALISELSRMKEALAARIDTIISDLNEIKGEAKRKSTVTKSEDGRYRII